MTRLKISNAIVPFFVAALVMAIVMAIALVIDDRLITIAAAAVLLAAFLFHLAIRRASSSQRIKSQSTAASGFALVGSSIAYYLAPSYAEFGFNSFFVPLMQASIGIKFAPIAFPEPKIEVLPFVLVGLAIIMFAPTRRHAMIPKSRDEIWASPDFSTQLAKTGVLLERHLRQLDSAADWSSQDFVALNAEVEKDSTTDWQRGVGDLLKMLQTDRTEAPILILGEPGSGKSVALRKLCNDLLAETPATKRLPVYINLRNWVPAEEWTEGRPPKNADLRQYVQQYLKIELDDVFADRFFDTYFDQMLEHGVIFFVFDSFDEIPAVMDQPEHGWLVSALSGVVGSFLHGAHAARGIVASRYYKRPTGKLGQGSVYRIKPFDDKKISTVLAQAGRRSSIEIMHLFRNRPDLVAFATNPLCAHLLAMYAKRGDKIWPDSKFDLFHDYLLGRLSDPYVQSRMRSGGVGDTSVCVNAAIAVAISMTEDDSHGLEISSDILASRFPVLPIISSLETLKFARLGRLSSVGQGTFSFAHRRFQEFFVVLGMLRSELSVRYSPKVLDNRYRDIFALYCEVADRQIAESIIDQVLRIATSEPSGIAEDEINRIQALRFLVEAVRSRKDLPEQFLDDLAYYVSKELGSSTKRPLLAKFACEAIGLLDDYRAARVFPLALGYPSAWVREAAFRACRHIGSISTRIERATLDLVLRYRYGTALGYTLIRRHEEIHFSLGVSSAFRRVKLMEQAWLIDVFVALIAIFGLLLLSPLLGSMVLGALYLASYILRSLSTVEAYRAARRIAFFAFLGLSTLLLAALSPIYFFSLSSYLDAQSLVLPWLPILSGDIPARHTFGDGLYRLLVLASLVLTFVPIAPLLCEKWIERRTILIEANNKVQSTVASLSLPSFSRVGLFFKGGATQVASMAKFFRAMPRSEQRLVYRGLALVVLLVALVAAVFVVYGQKGILLIVAVPTIGALMYALPLAAIKKLFQSRADHAVLMSVRFSGAISRSTIESAFEQLRGPRARLDFVRRLACSHVSPTGTWKSGYPPFRENDAASDELMRLEERWLGLDR